MQSHQESLNILPTIGITVGDAAGIGPEIVLKSLSDRSLADVCRPVMIGDARVIEKTARQLAVECELTAFDPGRTRDARYEIVDLANLADEVKPGVETAATGRASGEYIEKAVELWRSGEIDAMATAPISKKALQAGGYNFPGHTEFLADLTNTKEFAMSFFAEKLRQRRRQELDGPDRRACAPR